MLNPEMMAQMGPQMAPQMGPEMMGPEMMGPESEEMGSASAILEEILNLADQYRQQEGSQQNLLLVEKLRTIAQQILANEEKELDGAMQGKLSPASIRRFSG